MSYFFHSERAASSARNSDYMVSDHRAAADLGITGYEARDWSKRPFWRN